MRFELRHSARDVRLERAERAVEDPGSVLVGHVLSEREREGGPLARSEVHECSLEVVTQERARLRIERVFLYLYLRIGAAGSSAGRFGEERVVGDLAEPRREARSPRVAGETSVRAQKCLLPEVVGEGVISGRELR